MEITEAENLGAEAQRLIEKWTVLFYDQLAAVGNENPGMNGEVAKANAHKRARQIDPELYDRVVETHATLGGLRASSDWAISDSGRRWSEVEHSINASKKPKGLEAPNAGDNQ